MVVPIQSEVIYAYIVGPRIYCRLQITLGIIRSRVSVLCSSSVILCKNEMFKMDSESIQAKEERFFGIVHRMRTQLEQNWLLQSRVYPRIEVLL